jgi:RNA polymerase sigma-70 factor (ECF subfamily)
MRAATLPLAERSLAENTPVAQGLKRHYPQIADQPIFQYQHLMLRYLLYLTKPRDRRGSLRETWMRVLQGGAQYNGNARFDTWLFTIARNLLIDLRRKRTMVSLEELCENTGDDRPLEISSSEPSPFEHYQSSESGKRVAAAMLLLDPLHREVLTLRFHEELSLEEIAQVTRAPLSTVKSRLYRGLAALKPKISAVARGQHGF